MSTLTASFCADVFGSGGAVAVILEANWPFEVVCVSKFRFFKKPKLNEKINILINMLHVSRLCSCK